MFVGPSVKGFFLVLIVLDVCWAFSERFFLSVFCRQVLVFLGLFSLIMLLLYVLFETSLVCF